MTCDCCKKVFVPGILVQEPVMVKGFCESCHDTRESTRKELFSTYWDGYPEEFTND